MNLDNQNLSQVSHELFTIRDYVRWALSRFNATHLYYGHGTDNAWDEAVYLVLSALHLPPDISQDLMNSTLTLVERRFLCELISRRISERIPAAYLTQEAWFAGLSFYIDQRVIIPRSPIAELIENGFSPWLEGKTVHRILDLCTGSGCIAIACALAFAGSEVDAVDISSEALDVAKINVKKYGLEHNVQLIESDLFKKVSNQYDVIVSNPPYISHFEYESLPREYTHEPILALKAQKEGMAVAIQILKEAGRHLSPDGILVVEVGHSQEALQETYPQVPFLWLDFSRGGEGVFLLTAEQLNEYQHIFDES
jgi:ribosomal protein L3 glutamine methyltransferase